MRVAAAENRDIAVGCNHRPGLTHNALNMLFADRVEDALAAALLRDPDRRFGRVFDRGLEPAHARDVRQVLAGEGAVETAARDDDVLRVAAAALLQDDARALGLDALVRG